MKSSSYGTTVRLGIASLLAAAALLSIGFLSAVAAKPNNKASTATCTISSVTVGSMFIISGTGFTPGASYVASVIWPSNNGSGGVPVTADASGSWSQGEYAYWTGAYTVNVNSVARHPALLATCSMMVT